MIESEGQNDPANRIVRRRQVIYVPGYDPAHARRYRELYRREGRRQAALLGYDLALRAIPGQGAYAWAVTATVNGQTTQTRIDAFIWSDIVRRSMEGGIFTPYGLLLRTAWIYLSTGTLFRLMRLRKGPILAAVYPVTVLLAQLVVALGVAWLCGLAIGGLVGVGHQWLGLAALGIVPAVLIWFRTWDGPLLARYLMHDFAFTAEAAAGYPPALAARLDQLTTCLAGALTSDADEVLVIGHSSGAQLAVSALANLLRQGRGPTPREGPALSFLSLGQVIPMASFLPQAEALRADLALLSDTDALTWVDVSAPGDGCSFALCDPVAVSGAAQKGKRWPLVLSAAFRQTLRPETWARLRWRFFRLHFQYLCAFDSLSGRPDEYDYFRITAGPLTLAGRLGARSPSPARIEAPLSGYGASSMKAPMAV